MPERLISFQLQIDIRPTNFLIRLVDFSSSEMYTVHLSQSIALSVRECMHPYNPLWMDMWRDKIGIRCRWSSGHSGRVKLNLDARLNCMRTVVTRFSALVIHRCSDRRQYELADVESNDQSSTEREKLFFNYVLVDLIQKKNIFICLNQLTRFGE